MDTIALSNLLFPNVTMTEAELEEKYPLLHSIRKVNNEYSPLQDFLQEAFSIYRFKKSFR